MRGELLRDPEAELPELAGTASVYSSPEGLWAEGRLADERRARARHRGRDAHRREAAQDGDRAISARVIARPRSGASRCSWPRPASSSLIENDQTVRAGTLPALQTFFDVADRAGVSLGMTFDMGNWHWLGECPLQAAQQLAQRVRYALQGRAAAAAQVDRGAAGRLRSAPWRAVPRALPADVPHAIEYARWATTSRPTRATQIGLHPLPAPSASLST